ncbi:MAG: fibronectin type III domain-containing protein, partial [bacterium]|nr:fibronectin type III domain-containing protein [bacterium]
MNQFLADKALEDWLNTQTLAPLTVSADTSSNTSILVSWNRITYTGESGGYRVYYSTSAGGPWTLAGITPDKLIEFFDVTGLTANTAYFFKVKTQTDPHGSNDNTVISEASELVAASSGTLAEKPPFGSFDTPIHGSTVFSSVPVTGWALDDAGIDNVKIYRKQNNSLVYIGDAILVENARPDVAALYPLHPNNTKAGWGYMLLTNSLPGNGNGTFDISAIATDTGGVSTTLGSKTIICDNANAVKPFGAI